MASICRKLVVSELQSSLPINESINIESLIYDMCVVLSIEYSDNINDVYVKYSYEKLGELLTFPDKKDKILKDIKMCIIDWNSCVYEEYKNREEKNVNETVEGPKISKGTFQCKVPTCNSLECNYVQVQSRGADEGPTTHVFCLKCGDRYHFS